MRRKGTQGDGNTLLSKLRANGWGQRGEGPSQKGPQRGGHPWKGRALERRGITALEKPRRKEERSSCSSVPVVPVFQYSSIPINFETPPFSLIINNYLITN